MARGNNSIQVNLTPSIAKEIGESVASGNYADEAAVVRDALKRWAEAKRRFNESIDRSNAAIDRGEGISREDLMKRLEQKIKRAQNGAREKSGSKPRRGR